MSDPTQRGAAMPSETPWVIEVLIDDEAEARLAYDAIENLLFEMGETGTLCFSRMTLRVPPAGRGDG